MTLRPNGASAGVHLRRRMVSGAIDLDTFPSESASMAEHDVSPAVACEAITRPQAAGFVRTLRG